MYKDYIPACQSIIQQGLIALIRLYRWLLSPFLMHCGCRFYPTCSHYVESAIRQYGVVRGLAKGGVRIVKCHPFHPGGYDPVIKPKLESASHE